MNFETSHNTSDFEEITFYIKTQNIDKAFNKIIELNSKLDEQEYSYITPLISYLLDSRKHKEKYDRIISDLKLGVALFDKINFLNNSKLIRDYLIFHSALNKKPDVIKILKHSFENLKNNRGFTEESLANISKMLAFIRNRYPNLKNGSEKILNEYSKIYQEYKNKIELHLANNYDDSVPLNSFQKPKVALCISGQLRSFKEGSPSIVKYIIDEYRPDVFIHTWDKVGTRLPKELTITHSYKSAFPEKFCNEIKKNKIFAPVLFARYPSLKKTLLNLGELSETEIKKAYGERVNLVIEKKENSKEKFEKFQGIPAFKKHPNQLKMYYKIWSCNELKKEQEKKQGYKYDVVIRLRSDQPLEKKFTPESIQKVMNNEHLIFNDGVYAYGYGDIIAYGSSKAMDYYAGTWLNFNKFSELDRLPALRLPVAGHSILFDFIYYSEFDVCHCPDYKLIALLRYELTKDKIKACILSDRFDNLDQIDHNLLESLK
jgi:hypothetical protein